MVLDIWQRTIHIAREETCCRHYLGYSFRLAARVLLYVPSHRQDSTYHSLCYTICGALAGWRNSLMGPPWRINLNTHCTMGKCSYHWATSCSTLLSMTNAGLKQNPDYFYLGRGTMIKNDGNGKSELTKFTSMWRLVFFVILLSLLFLLFLVIWLLLEF